MARRKNRKRSRRSAPRSKKQRKSGRRRSRKGGGGKMFRVAGLGIAKPSIDAVKIGGAMAAGEVLLIILENLTGFDVPDEIPTKAIGLMAYAVLIDEDPKLQQVAYGLAVCEFVEGTDMFAEAKQAAIEATTPEE